MNTLITDTQIADLIVELRTAVLPTDTGELAARAIEQLIAQMQNLNEQTTSYLRQAREANEVKTELSDAIKELIEYVDNEIPIHPRALIADEARTALAKAQS